MKTQDCAVAAGTGEGHLAGLTTHLVAAAQQPGDRRVK